MVIRRISYLAKPLLLFFSPNNSLCSNAILPLLDASIISRSFPMMLIGKRSSSPKFNYFSFKFYTQRFILHFLSFLLILICIHTVSIIWFHLIYQYFASNVNHLFSFIICILHLPFTDFFFFGAIFTHKFKRFFFITSVN
jgi:hypothetical protein